MVKIKNINEKYGECATFYGTDVQNAVKAMALAIDACGYDVRADELREDIDYEVVG